MKLGSSLRFLFPSSDHTTEIYQALSARLPPGAFMERPLGDTDIARQARNLDEVAIAAREAGMWALIVGDHHNMDARYATCFQPVPTIARLSGSCGTMTVGAVFLAPFYHPLLLAEQIATIAAFVDTPTMWTFAVGDNQRTFDGFGLDRRRRGVFTDAVVDVVRALLDGHTVTATTDEWTVQEASISPLPRHPVTIMTAGAARGAVERAGRVGDGWLTAQNATVDELAAQLRWYEQACARQGRSPLPVLRRDIHVAPSDEAALAHVEPIVAQGYRGVTMERLLVGSPETVVAALRRYDELGFHHVLVRHITGDHQAMLESFRLIGESVIPEVDAWPT